MITKEELYRLCSDDTIFLTQHFILRMKERRIRYGDLVAVVQNGDIIEQYPEDYPYPSCLVAGLTLQKKILHVVCGVGEGILSIITAYYPSPDKFEEDGRTRREESK